MSSPNSWTDVQLAALRDWYARGPSKPVRLDELAKSIGKIKANVCRKARSLGLTNLNRPKAESRKPPKARKFESDEDRRRVVGARVKALWAERGHPKGMLGKKHTPETIQKVRDSSVEMWANPKSKVNTAEHRQLKSDSMVARIVSGKMRSGYTRSAGGKRADLDNRYFRSAWEANYARYLNLLKSSGKIAGWEFETKTFVFEKIKRGTRAYTPDFKILKNDGTHEWHEVKGWMDPKSKTRLDRMGRYYPEEKVVIIGEPWFRDAKRSGLSGAVAGWEHQGRGSRGC